MKYSQQIGVLAILALAAVCFMPWVYIAIVNVTVTGFNAAGTNFGKPGLLGMVFGAVMVVLFLAQKIWAKRTNVFIGAIVFAWSIKNFIVLSACFAGDCPEKRIGLYLQLVFSFIALLMTFFPKIDIPVEKE